jgi:glycosyltransferase involved in cell wall biosynthesis
LIELNKNLKFIPKMPRISIITINYNNLEGLKRTMESVVNQIWQEFEYIVIDGGSTDGSTAYIKSQRANIDYWVSEPDNGIYNAMNKGIKVATGEYLLFLNSGDHLYNDKVFQENNRQIVNSDLIYFNWQVIGDNFSKVVPYPDELQFSNLFFGSLPHQATFMKKALFDKFGLYDENLKIASDWKFIILALFIHRCSYRHVNETFSTFYLDGISNKLDFTDEREQVLNEYFGAYVSDYKTMLDLKRKKEILETNRFRMLSEIEKSLVAKKTVSVLFRLYVILFTKNKLKDILCKK